MATKRPPSPLQLGAPELLTVVPYDQSAQLAELARLRGTRCRYLGEQSQLFEAGTVPLVEVVNGATVLVVSEEEARRFGLRAVKASQ